MVKNGLVFGTEMHLATAIVILVEFVFLIHQVFSCLENPHDKQRIRYFWLLFLLLAYNITGGVFPDKHLAIPIFWQSLICYGGGLAVSAYIPFYFYRSYAIHELKFHVKWGVWLFLIFPFYIFFIVGYILTRNIETAVNCGMAIPLIYSFILQFAIGKAIYHKYSHEPIANILEIVLMFISIFPWGLMAIMSIVGISQLQELILANVGFLFFRVFYVKEEFRERREKDTRVHILEKEIIQIQELLTTKPLESNKVATPSGHDLFERNCREFLTPTQTTVIKMISDGLSYKEVAQARNVSEDAIKDIMQKISLRLNVKGKAAIVEKLNSTIEYTPDNQIIN